MSFLFALALQQAALPLAEVLPASDKAVVDHIDALYRGDLDGALAFVADDVENTVTNLVQTTRLPRGRVIAKAAYLAATNRGKLTLSHFDCKMEGVAVRCDLLFGTDGEQRKFVMRYWADSGPITRIYSWEDHEERSK